jgi:hypothetical protein
VDCRRRDTGQGKGVRGKPGIVLPGLHKQHKKIEKALILQGLHRLKTRSHKMLKKRKVTEHLKIMRRKENLSIHAMHGIVKSVLRD